MRPGYRKRHKKYHKVSAGPSSFEAGGHLADPARLKAADKLRRKEAAIKRWRIRKQDRRGSFNIDEVNDDEI